MGANFGIAGLDWQQRVNWDRLRSYRTERAREMMKRHGLGAMLCMYDENVRYITGTLTPGWNRLKPGLRYAMLCGDGKIGIGEQCDLGAANADRPAFELEWVFGKIGVRPLESKQSVQSFYGYSSASSHTGLEASGTSHMLLHRNVATGQLSLVMFHGIDLDATGQSQPASTVTFDIAGLPPSTFVTVVDDTLSEFNKSSGTTAFGNWQFSNNTDGGVLSGLPVPGSWEIPVSASFSPGIKTWFFDGITQTVTVSQGSAGKLILRAYATPAKCRTNCTIPKCGDGVLDGGEVCDDGNTIDGDGCSKACTSTP